MPESKSFGQFEQDGFHILESVLCHIDCDSLAAELTPLLKQQQQGSKAGGVRNLLRLNQRIAQFANSAAMLALVERFTAKPAFPVRAIFFDKNPTANWLVTWHQDLAIALAERIETPGFGGWSVKDGVTHAHPPREILESMVTLRLHLDDCNASNGALRVLPGSHRHGKLDAAEISKLTKVSEPTLCEISKGGVLLMRPLLLHASSQAENPSHRRVLHIEYATNDLPNGLQWFERNQRSAIAFVALGSNLGESRQIFAQAIAQLQEFSASPLVQSSFIETAPMDCPPGSPDFLNAVVGLVPRAGETPESLHAKLQALEKEFGRATKKVLNEPRPLDLDLIAFGDETRNSPQLTLPHPRAHLRKFVLQPLAEIAPDFVLPGQKKSAAELLAAL
jgi:2-amino-4-hydroxy-6-hydroxymethyldihydropteridine diphosphokinase